MNADTLRHLRARFAQLSRQREALLKQYAGADRTDDEQGDTALTLIHIGWHLDDLRLILEPELDLTNPIATKP